MSEQQHEQTTPPVDQPQAGTQPTPESQPQPQPQPAASPQSSETTYPIRLVKRETGATHYVDGGARVDLVRHGETGEPESEYAVVGTIDGVDVTLWSGNAGRIDTIVSAQQKAQQAQQDTAV